MRITKLITAAFLLFANPAAAQNFMSLGAGTQISCGNWLAKRESKQFYSEGNWALGFLSGAAWMGPASHDPLGKTDSDGVFYWLDKYCQERPTTKFSDALQAFYKAHTQ